MTCDFEQNIERYHDAELDESGRVLVQAHLLECSACRGYLAHLEQVTDRFATSFHRFELEIPAQFSMRLHREVGRAIDESMDQGVLRLAMSFASVAAVVLIAATVGLVELRQPTTQAPQSWESAALAIQSDSSASAVGGASQVASASMSSSMEPDLILADLSRRDAQ